LSYTPMGACGNGTLQALPTGGRRRAALQGANEPVGAHQAGSITTAVP